MDTSQLTAFLAYDDKTEALHIGKMTSFEEIYVDLKTEKVRNGSRFQLALHPKQNIILQNVGFQLPFAYASDMTVFCNGYQSWSESREFELTESFKKILLPARSKLSPYGDYNFPNIQWGKGFLHSWTYSYVRLPKDEILFIGSLNEKSAFTLIQHEHQKGRLTIESDCANLELQHSFPLMDILILKGKEQDVFNTYFELLDCPPPTAQRATGWTSWYHYYTDVSEEIVLKNLEAFAKKEVPIDIFQIDDGWQQHIGDWFDVDASFPNGMKTVCQNIHQKGYRAGLWLAPFICEPASNIYKNKKHWLLKDEKGKAVVAGYAPHWSGNFYALNIYHAEVRDYLTKVFYTVLQNWQFDLVKLDFLYAACLHPPKNKTRGQVMHDAMQFLREVLGDKLLLACGVPLASAFGIADYCRIGADIHLKWEHRLLKFLRNRERVSTILSLRTTLGRWHLNGRVFQNDPDVFMLRTTKNDLTPTQQFTILTINALLGNLLFTSDFVADYDAEQWSAYQLIFNWKTAVVQQVVRLQKDVYQIKFTHDGFAKSAFCNLTTGKVRLKNRELQAFETLIFSDFVG